MYTFELTDSGGDGWDGNEFELWQDGELLITLGPQLLDGPGPINISVPMCEGRPFHIVRTVENTTDDEISLSFRSVFNEVIYAYPQMQVNHQPQYTGTATCTADQCYVPTDFQVFDYDGGPKLHWTTGGNATFDIFVVPFLTPGPGPEEAGNVTACPFDLSSLQGPYDIYVRTHCFWGGVSEWGAYIGHNTILDLPRQDRHGLSLSPVPAHDFVTISHTYNGAWKAVIFDVMGRNITDFSGVQSVSTVDVSTLQPGIYYLAVAFESGAVETQRLVVR